VIEKQGAVMMKADAALVAMGEPTSTSYERWEGGSPGNQSLSEH
jgi:hypothetical protein